MNDISLTFFQCVCLQNQIRTLPHQVSCMPRRPLPVVPPSTVAPFTVMLCQVGQIVLLIYRVANDMVDAVQGLLSNSFILQTQR